MTRKKTIAAAEHAYIYHFQSEPTGGYTVTCPSLPPVISHGETLEEARANAREAIELYLEILREEGPRIPPADQDPRKPIDELVPVRLSAE